MGTGSQKNPKSSDRVYFLFYFSFVLLLIFLTRSFVDDFESVVAKCSGRLLFIDKTKIFYL